MGSTAILGTLQPFQICIFNRKDSKFNISKWPSADGKGFMAKWHASLDSTCKSRISKFSFWGVHSTTFHPKLRNERFTLISLMGSTAILGTLQPFQICIFNRKDSKFNISKWPSADGKRFMAKWHASLDSTCKSRISKILILVGPFYNFSS